MVPALTGYIYVVLWPAVQGSIFAFTDWNGLTSDFSFVGLDNFIKVIQDSAATRAITNTIVLAVVVTVLQNLVGLFLALGLNSKVKSRGVLRTVFFAPVVLTPLVAGYIWSYLLAPRGAVNDMLETVGLGQFKQDWLGNPDTALGAICVTLIWQFAGYSMVIFLSGLQAIPQEINEAAVLDGAGPIRRLVSVTLPLLNGAIVINLLLTMIGGLGQFAHVYIMTNGGPFGSTETISTLILRKAFQTGDFPYGIALGVVMALIVGVFAITQYRLTLRQVDE